MKNTSVSSFNFMMLLGVLLFLNTNTVKASADSLFVVSGNLGGVGIGLEADSVYIHITEIVPNRPAYRNGQLKVGDRIIGVGQGASGEIIDIKGKTLEEVIGMIGGRVGTKVRLAILPADNIKSDPPLIVELVRESIRQVINISNADTWYFKPGDNIAWAKPDYDDSNWHSISPGGLAIDAMPDSLWNGYGWWRLTFTADSSFYAENWNLNFSAWGAAEVYLDGELVHRAGNFSIYPDEENTYSLRNIIHLPVDINENDKHTIAIRYSHHQGNQYSRLFKKDTRELGFGLWFGTLPQLTADRVNQNGILGFSNSEAWKYQPGDDLQWADPDFDDTGWYAIPPGGLGIDAMPDSLWNGYGWWRYTFTADSSFYNENWNLFFNGWGAAEVFLDGERVHQFGNFSTDPDKERTFSPRVAIFPPVNITEKETHTLAIRYSHHQAKSYNSIIKVFAGNLGFGFGFGTHALNQDRAQLITYLSFSLFISAAVLFVLLLLHFMLFYKFPEDRSNLFISVLLGLLLISAVTSTNFVYLEVTRYWSSMLRWIFLISTSFSILFLPYVIAEIFKLEKQKKVLWLIAAIPLLFVPDNLLNQTLGNYITLIIFSIAIFLIGYICWKAYKSGKRGVGYVAFGALGTLIFGIFTTLRIFGQSFQVESVMITFIYTLFPLGMTLYVANGYGYLFTSLEGEIADRTKKLNQSLEDLKNTQSQLVQQEKLASLGQLTAGIAHEIKNPLNFVNNFSEVSIEMIEEIMEARGEKREARAKDQESKSSPENRETKNQEKERVESEELEDEILEDIKANLKKIHEHGSRANGIVSSMLQHSRGGDGKMEPTDLNALLKEYVNLSFHGMRAGKDPINVAIDLQLDEQIRNVPLVSEDFSRVLLNLCNNAFDAMREKLKMYNVQCTKYQDGAHSEVNYLPKLKVTTKLEKGKVQISFEDNGTGIPDDIKEKILQPFFTTKKGTEGTGLGLSITNDIIKAHGGSLDIQSQPGCTIFIIHLTL
jgi:signal transduction histidine kinase